MRRYLVLLNLDLFMSLTKKSGKLFTLVIVVFVLQWTGCENNFHPLGESNEYELTMYGALDLHADTQWVRVMPIGERLIPGSSESNNVTVELIREKNGETTMLNDSLFIFGGDAHVWNYWTTERLHSNEEYILRAATPGGKQSSATVTIPPPLPIPTINEVEGIVSGWSPEPIVTADIKLYLRLISEIGSVSSINTYNIPQVHKVFRESNGEYLLRYNLDGLVYRAIQRSDGYRIVRKTLVIAQGSEDWPDLTELSDLETAIPNIASNVENGTGYIGGIARREIPLKSCFDDDGVLIPCQEIN